LNSLPNLRRRASCRVIPSVCCWLRLVCLVFSSFTDRPPSSDSGCPPSPFLRVCFPLGSAHSLIPLLFTPRTGMTSRPRIPQFLLGPSGHLSRTLPKTFFLPPARPCIRVPRRVRIFSPFICRSSGDGIRSIGGLDYDAIIVPDSISPWNFFQGTHRIARL